MLVLWRRHANECPHDSRDSRRCACPIWFDWRIGGKRIRKPMKTKDWQVAQIKARQSAQASMGTAINCGTRSLSAYCKGVRAWRTFPCSWGTVGLPLRRNTTQVLLKVVRIAWTWMCEKHGSEPYGKANPPPSPCRIRICRIPLSTFWLFK
jgi:hypothetical protein